MNLEVTGFVMVFVSTVLTVMTLCVMLHGTWAVKKAPFFYRNINMDMMLWFLSGIFFQSVGRCLAFVIVSGNLPMRWDPWLGFCERAMVPLAVAVCYAGLARAIYRRRVTPTLIFRKEAT